MTGIRPRAAVVIVSYNTRELTLRALASLPVADDRWETWVVDNASDDGSVDAIRAAFPAVRLEALDRNLGFGLANNRAMEKSRAPFFLLLNSDAFLRRPEDLDALVSRMEAKPGLGVLGPRIVSEDGSLQYSARAFPTITGELVRRFFLHRLPVPGLRRRLEGRLLGEYFPHDEPRSVDWVVGACMLVRREAFDEVGGFDPERFMYGEEQEWCYRIGRAGWEVRFDPAVEVMHRKAGSSGATGTAWRVRASLEGDAYLLRRSRGPGYALLFASVRLLGAAFQSVAFGVARVVRPSEYVRARGREALLTARQQARLLIFRRGAERS